MAERRMFTKKITDADEFISLPSSTQALYLHLCMAADDDGFNNQVQMAMYKAHASVDDVKILLAKRYIIQFENGVIVIKHWRMANALRKDRYTATTYQDEFQLLKIKENGAYTLSDDLVANGLPDGCQTVTVGKDSIDKNSIEEDSLGKDRGYGGKGEAEPVQEQKPVQEEDDEETYYTTHSNVNNLKHFLNTHFSDYKHAQFVKDNPQIYEAMCDWMAYKDARKPRTKHHYVSEQSVKSFISRVVEQTKTYGADPVVDVIQMSMGNNWDGIIWDKIKTKADSPKRMIVDDIKV